jgi:hypothetical protein
MGGGIHPLIISSTIPNPSILPILPAPCLQFSLVPCIMPTDAYNPNSNSIEGLYSRRTLPSCILVLSYFAVVPLKKISRDQLL